jgi:hypothetical protein
VWLTDQSINQSINQSVSQSPADGVAYDPITQSTGLSLDCDSIKVSIYYCVVWQLCRPLEHTGGAEVFEHEYYSWAPGKYSQVREWIIFYFHHIIHMYVYILYMYVYDMM